MNKIVKAPQVQGMFYPREPSELSYMIETFIEEAPTLELTPKAIIAPHAGYIYSGPVAATAYKTLFNIKKNIKNVTILSPAHRYPLQGIAYSNATHFKTPLGELRVNTENLKKLNSIANTEANDLAFEGEHALEVHLPFVQKIFDDVTITPLIVGQISKDNIAAVFDLLDAPDNLFIVSSDLSHFNSYADANQIDKETASRIEQCEDIESERACGHYPLLGIMQWCKSNNLSIETVDLRNSGDTAGDKTSVVGYGAFVITEKKS